MPDEARQPSMFIEMVPIHTKHMLWEMGEGIVYYAFLPSCGKAFYFAEK